MKVRYKGYILLGIMSLFLLSGCGRNEVPEKEEAGLISFEGQDIEGNLVSSSVLSESKLTMVNVWATYCNPCLREMPGLGELAKEYDPWDFQIIRIMSDVQEGAAEQAL